MKITLRCLALFALPLAFILTACEDDQPPPSGDMDYSQGILVVNEGNFGGSNSTVTYNNRSTFGVEIPFLDINDRPLGDVANSLNRMNGKVYVVVNNSSKIEVVDPVTFEASMTISTLTSPRYVMQLDADRFVATDWGTNAVHFYHFDDPLSYNFVTVGAGPEQMALADGKLFVANSGGFGLDNSISVIDPVTETLIQTITVADAPMQLQVDANGKLWVLCRGDYGDFNDLTDDTPGELWRINPQTYAVELALPFNVGDHPARMTINETGTKIYFLNGPLYSIDASASAGPAAEFSPRWFYGIGVDPVTGFIYASDPVDYVSKGWALRFRPDGTVVDSFRTGIIPGDFLFSE